MCIAVVLIAFAGSTDVPGPECSVRARCTGLADGKEAREAEAKRVSG